MTQQRSEKEQRELDKEMMAILVKPPTEKNIDALNDVLARGANPNLEIKGKTSMDCSHTRPLHVALTIIFTPFGTRRDASPDYVMALLAYGADPNAQNEFRQNALHFAVNDINTLSFRDRLAIAKALCEKGADPAARDKWGVSPCEGQTLETVEQRAHEWKNGLSPYKGRPWERALKTLAWPFTLYTGHGMALFEHVLGDSDNKRHYQTEMRELLDAQVEKLAAARRLLLDQGNQEALPEVDDRKPGFVERLSNPELNEHPRASKRSHSIELE